ncbi:RNA-binding S4 domain-containing protein [Haliangium sp.]|uniref:RNA-binding S4 domain-containing protein n=1 Tax=Haliangium sp. TaxID=2663208 RepID=UPI003D0E6B42
MSTDSHPPHDQAPRGGEAQVRVDKWLWAARFFKTRSIAATAIASGKVELNGERPKRAKGVKLGDRLRIRKGLFEHEVVVLKLSERRGPATEAQTMYEETEDSRQQREAVAEHMRLEREAAPPPIPRFGKGRPTKRERRQLDRFKGDE